jgi:transposase
MPKSSLPEDITMNQAILGIDVSKETFDAALIVEGNTHHVVMSNSTVGFTRLRNWLISRKASCTHACMEATGQYGEALAEFLFAEGYSVSVVNPLRIKRYGQSKLHRNKTDKADAYLIAEFCAKEKPALWKPLPPEVKQLRQLVRRLDDLQTTYQQERNRLASGVSAAWVREDLRNHIHYLQQAVKSARNAIQQLVDAFPELKHQQDLLRSIPGIGALTASHLLAEIGDITTFEDAPQLAAFAALNPKGERSGTSVFKKAHISKEGRAFLRYILYMPALVAKKRNAIIKTFCQRLEQGGRPKMVIVAAAMRKLLHLVFGILKHQKIFDPLYLTASITT